MPDRGTLSAGTRTLVGLAAAVIVVAGMKAAANVLLPVVVAVFLTMIGLPLLQLLRRCGVPRSLAVLITIVTQILILVGAVLVLGGSVRGFTAAVPRYQERLEMLAVEAIGWLESQGFEVSRELVFEWINPGVAFDLLTGTFRGVTAVLSNLILVVLTAVFMMLEAAGFPDKLERAFGRTGTSERIDRMRVEINRYLGAKTVISLATAVLITSGLALLQVDFPLLWGFVAFCLNYIPNLGSIIAGVPPFLLALIQHGPGRALGVLVLFVAVNVTLGNFVEPIFMGRRLGLSTLVVFLSLLFWGWVWGPFGMLLSVPLTMIVKIMLENSEDFRWVGALLDASPRPKDD
jgi:predicted PurR-regulated permease PerM